MLLSIPVLTFVLYNNLGASADQHITELIQRSADTEPSSSEGAELSSQLYSALQKRVVQRPENIYYWAMLAQQTLAKGDIQTASDYYRQAIEVIPNDGYLLAQYAETLFILANSQFTETVVEVVDRAFAIDSSNPTILGLKGIQAFENQQWQLAITYWQGAMQQIDQNSVTASALQTGIARAEAQLQQTELTQEPSNGAPTGVELLVSIDPAISYSPEQTVFVALVAPSGPPMPLAARKLRAGDLPIQISLSDADAVMAGYNLSSVKEFKAIARLSQSGSATPQSGDWEVSSDTLKADAQSGLIELRVFNRRP
jgi:cytochrome c-type biogenesis protein CcmH